MTAQNDYSTINLDVLRKLRVHKCPPTYEYSHHKGAACAGDPPGYPTYFTQAVYTQYGNSPKGGSPSTVLAIPGEEPRVVDSNVWQANDTWDKQIARKNALMKRLWNKLPLDHPRVQLWIKSTYRHHNHCFMDDSIEGSYSDKMFIWPVPDYKLESFTADKRFSGEWQNLEKARVEQANKKIKDRYRPLAIPENSSAYRIIAKYYPEFKAENHQDLINEAESVKECVPTWWERLAECPSLSECPGYTKSHPVNSTWCQVCGWKAEESKSA